MKTLDGYELKIKEGTPIKRSKYTYIFDKMEALRPGQYVEIAVGSVSEGKNLRNCINTSFYFSRRPVLKGYRFSYRVGATEDGKGVLTIALHKQATSHGRKLP
jgi:hypothetical protein